MRDRSISLIALALAGAALALLGLNWSQTAAMRATLEEIEADFRARRPISSTLQLAVGEDSLFRGLRVKFLGIEVRETMGVPVAFAELMLVTRDRARRVSLRPAQFMRVEEYGILVRGFDPPSEPGGDESGRGVEIFAAYTGEESAPAPSIGLGSTPGARLAYRMRATDALMFEGLGVNVLRLYYNDVDDQSDDLAAVLLSTIDLTETVILQEGGEAVEFGDYEVTATRINPSPGVPDLGADPRQPVDGTLQLELRRKPSSAPKPRRPIG